MMRYWIGLCEMRNAITQGYIPAAYRAMEHAVPDSVIVDLTDDHIFGFVDLPNMVEIAYIETPANLRGQGHASTALHILTELADQMAVTLVVTAAESDDDSEWPISSADLAAFYERNGFIGSRKMIRSPSHG